MARQSSNFLMKTKHSGQVHSLIIWLLLCFCKPVIGLWALQKHNALELARAFVILAEEEKRSMLFIMISSFTVFIILGFLHVFSHGLSLLWTAQE